MEEYKRSLHDELEWVEIEQLHAATMKISDNCFEYKKLCVSIFGVAITILVKFTDNKLDFSIFLIGLLIAIGFLGADATAYYYQRVLRKKMDTKKNEIALRHSTPYILPIYEPSWIGSIFNQSMSIYYALIGLMVLGAILFNFGFLNS